MAAGEGAGSSEERPRRDYFKQQISEIFKEVALIWRKLLNLLAALTLLKSLHSPQIEISLQLPNS